MLVLVLCNTPPLALIGHSGRMLLSLFVVDDGGGDGVKVVALVETILC